MGCTLAKDSAIVSTLPTMGADVPKVSKTDGEKDVSNAVNDASEAKEDTDSSKDKKEDDAIKSEDETKEVDQPEALPGNTLVICKFYFHVKRTVSIWSYCKMIILSAVFHAFHRNEQFHFLFFFFFTSFRFSLLLFPYLWI